MPDSPGPDLNDKEFGRLLFEWEIHPAGRNKKKLALLCIVSGVFLMFLIEVTKSFIITYLILLIYLFTLKSFIFKTYYRLYEKGLCTVQLGFNDRRSYSSFISVFRSDDSLLLSSVRKYSFIAKTRGIELVFEDPGLKKRVADFLEGKIAEDH